VLLTRAREHLPPGLQGDVACAVCVAVRDMVLESADHRGTRLGPHPGIALLADLNGYLRLNLRGQERRGLLEPDGDELERYIAWVRECFLGLRLTGT
jgi:hypothetical protein